MAILRDEMIGGATVSRGFTRGGEWVKPGAQFTRSELLAMPRANLQALVDTNKLVLFPPVPGMLEGQGEMHLINRGFGKWDIIQGRIVNEEPFLSRDAAEARLQELQAQADALPGEAAPEPETPAPN